MKKIKLLLIGLSLAVGHNFAFAAKLDSYNFNQNNGYNQENVQFDELNEKDKKELEALYEKHKKSVDYLMEFFEKNKLYKNGDKKQPIQIFYPGDEIFNTQDTIEKLSTIEFLKMIHTQLEKNFHSKINIYTFSYDNIVTYDESGKPKLKKLKIFVDKNKWNSTPGSIEITKCEIVKPDNDFTESYENCLEKMMEIDKPNNDFTKSYKKRLAKIAVATVDNYNFNQDNGYNQEDKRYDELDEKDKKELDALYKKHKKSVDYLMGFFEKNKLYENGDKKQPIQIFWPGEEIYNTQDTIEKLSTIKFLKMIHTQLEKNLSHKKNTYIFSYDNIVTYDESGKPKLKKLKIFVDKDKWNSTPGSIEITKCEIVKPDNDFTESYKKCLEKMMEIDKPNNDFTESYEKWPAKIKEIEQTVRESYNKFENAGKEKFSIRGYITNQQNNKKKFVALDKEKIIEIVMYLIQDSLNNNPNLVEKTIRIPIPKLIVEYLSKDYNNRVEPKKLIFKIKCNLNSNSGSSYNVNVDFEEENNFDDQEEEALAEYYNQNVIKIYENEEYKQNKNYYDVNSKVTPKNRTGLINQFYTPNNENENLFKNVKNYGNEEIGNEEIGNEEVGNEEVEKKIIPPYDGRKNKNIPPVVVYETLDAGVEVVNGKVVEDEDVKSIKSNFTKEKISYFKQKIKTFALENWDFLCGDDGYKMLSIIMVDRFQNKICDVLNLENFISMLENVAVRYLLSKNPENLKVNYKNNKVEVGEFFVPSSQKNIKNSIYSVTIEVKPTDNTYYSGLKMNLKLNKKSETMYNEKILNEFKEIFEQKKSDIFNWQNDDDIKECFACYSENWDNSPDKASNKMAEAMEKIDNFVDYSENKKIFDYDDTGKVSEIYYGPYGNKSYNVMSLHAFKMILKNKWLREEYNKETDYSNPYAGPNRKKLKNILIKENGKYSIVDIVMTLDRRGEFYIFYSENPLFDSNDNAITNYVKIFEEKRKKGDLDIFSYDYDITEVYNDYSDSVKLKKMVRKPLYLDSEYLLKKANYTVLKNEVDGFLKIHKKLLETCDFQEYIKEKKVCLLENENIEFLEDGEFNNYISDKILNQLKKDNADNVELGQSGEITGVNLVYFQNNKLKLESVTVYYFVDELGDFKFNIKSNTIAENTINKKFTKEKINEIKNNYISQILELKDAEQKEKQQENVNFQGFSEDTVKNEVIKFLKENPEIKCSFGKIKILNKNEEIEEYDIEKLISDIKNKIDKSIEQDARRGLGERYRWGTVSFENVIVNEENTNEKKADLKTIEVEFEEDVKTKKNNLTLTLKSQIGDFDYQSKINKIRKKLDLEKKGKQKIFDQDINKFIEDNKEKLFDSNSKIRIFDCSKKLDRCQFKEYNEEEFKKLIKEEGIEDGCVCDVLTYIDCKNEDGIKIKKPFLQDIEIKKRKGMFDDTENLNIELKENIENNTSYLYEKKIEKFNELCKTILQPTKIFEITPKINNKNDNQNQKIQNYESFQSTPILSGKTTIRKYENKDQTNPEYYKNINEIMPLDNDNDGNNISNENNIDNENDIDYETDLQNYYEKQDKYCDLSNKLSEGLEVFINNYDEYQENPKNYDSEGYFNKMQTDFDILDDLYNDLKETFNELVEEYNSKQDEYENNQQAYADTDYCDFLQDYCAFLGDCEDELQNYDECLNEYYNELQKPEEEDNDVESVYEEEDNDEEGVYEEEGNEDSVYEEGNEDSVYEEEGNEDSVYEEGNEDSVYEDDAYEEEGYEDYNKNYRNYSMDE